jgi:hypothetical protein
MATVWRRIDLGFIPFGLLYAAAFIGGFATSPTSGALKNHQLVISAFTNSQDK